MTLGQALDSGLLGSSIGIKINSKWVDKVEYGDRTGKFHLTFEGGARMMNVNDTMPLDNVK